MIKYQMDSYIVVFAFLGSKGTLQISGTFPVGEASEPVRPEMWEGRSAMGGPISVKGFYFFILTI